MSITGYDVKVLRLAKFKDTTVWNYYVDFARKSIQGAHPETLMWFMRDGFGGSPDGAHVLERCGNMAGTLVTAEEAQIVTGLDHPMAALDKLP